MPSSDRSDYSFRFSRDKRWFSPVALSEFRRTAVSLIDSIAFLSSQTKLMQESTGQVVTYEDLDTYNYSTVTFLDEEVSEALANRKSYTFPELTQEVWDRSFKVELCLRAKDDPTSFVIVLSCDRHSDARSMKFRGEGMNHLLYRAVITMFERPSFWVAIGDGRSKISDFNIEVGERVVGRRLSV